MDTNNQNMYAIIGIVVCILVVVCVLCCVSSSIGTLIYNAPKNTGPGSNPNPVPPGNNNENNPIIPPVPTIKFCSQPNLGGTCKSYDLSYKFYPFESQCGSNEIGFKPQSLIIENDDPSKYKVALKGYMGNTGDSHCGPSGVLLNASPNCYNSNIYGISGDRGTCISDTASGVSWIMGNTLGGIDVSKN